MTRESARVDQQQSLDELASTMEVQIRQSAVSAAASTSPGELPQMLAAQESIVPSSAILAPADASHSPSSRRKKRHDFPDMVMEDSDRLTIPHTPSTVSVVGDVYNPGSFIFEPPNSAGSYLEIAGKGKPQSDLHHAFVLRANGVVVAANNVTDPSQAQSSTAFACTRGMRSLCPTSSQREPSSVDCATGRRSFHNWP